MSSNQQTIDNLANLLRIQVIEFLIKKDYIDHKAQMPSDEELVYMKREIFNMNCCTKKLKSLFRDAHEMHEERDIFPRPVTVSDLEWCMKNRTIGYGCSQSVPKPWLPYKEDRELRTLPAFKELAQIYKPYILEKKPIPAPSKVQIAEDTSQIVKQLSQTLKMENALCSQN